MLLVSKKSAPLFANKGRRYRDAEGGTISSFLRLGELILHGENGGKSEDTHSLSDLDFDAQALMAHVKHSHAWVEFAGKVISTMYILCPLLSCQSASGP